MYAAWFNPNPEVTGAFLKAGADVNVQNNRGETPLMYAAMYNKNPEVITTLLTAGADVKAEDLPGKAAWITRRRTHVLQAPPLIDGFRKRLTNREGSEWGVLSTRQALRAFAPLRKRFGGVICRFHFPENNSWPLMTWVSTPGNVDGRRVPCRILRKALDDHFNAEREGTLHAFLRHRSEIEAKARELIEQQKCQPDGSILIHTLFFVRSM